MKLFLLASLLIGAVFAEDSIEDLKNDKTVEAAPPLSEQLTEADLKPIKHGSPDKSVTQCHMASADLVFVIDCSGSIGSRNFATVRSFLTNLVNEMSFPGVRVGVVEFNSYARGYFDLDSYSSASSVNSAISRMPYYGGGTNIATGMNYASNYAFTSSRGDRGGVDDIMVVMTDGQDYSNVANAHSVAAAKGIKVIAIGVGSGVNRNELLQVVGGDASLVHDVSSFNDLSSIISTICQQVATACDASPCLNGGTCTETNNGANYVCTCDADHTGPECQNVVDPCASGPCKNAGTCTRNGNSFTCQCDEDYTGVICDTYLDPCASSPCKNGASCERTSGTTHVCYCDNGFTGTNCETPICQHGGTFSCECKYGYTGNFCEKTIDFCNSTEIIVDGKYVHVDICGVHGSCTSTENGPICTCDLGWHGQFCQTDDNNCLSNPCKNGGTCVNLPGTPYACICDKLHTGKNCEDDIDLCNRDVIEAEGGATQRIPVCGDHGICEQNANGSICHCDEGWSGPFCHTHNPTACTYKNQTHPHNTTWTDHCTDCNCQFGVVQCAPSSWCPQRCAIFSTAQVIANNITVGCKPYENCVPETVECARENPACTYPVGYCFPVGYVVVDPRRPPPTSNYH